MWLQGIAYWRANQRNGRNLSTQVRDVLANLLFPLELCLSQVVEELCLMADQAASIHADRLHTRDHQLRPVAFSPSRAKWLLLRGSTHPIPLGSRA